MPRQQDKYSRLYRELGKTLSSTVPTPLSLQLLANTMAIGKHTMQALVEYGYLIRQSRGMYLLGDKFSILDPAEIPAIGQRYMERQRLISKMGDEWTGSDNAKHISEAILDAQKALATIKEKITTV